MSLNNETRGISAEVAFCVEYEIPLSERYRRRADEDTVKDLVSIFGEFRKDSPELTVDEHTAENQSVHDFRVNGTQTLSMKTTMHAGCEPVAPQVVGQATPITYWKHFGEPLGGYLQIDEETYNSLTYVEQCQLVKRFFMDNMEKCLDIYWDNLNSSDYFMVITGVATDNPKIRMVDLSNKPQWGDYVITTTRTVDTWNESNTIKLNGVAVAEFQIHRSRKCFKFRFKLKGLRKLGIIT